MAEPVRRVHKYKLIFYTANRPYRKGIDVLIDGASYSLYIGGIRSFLWPPPDKKSTGVYRKKLSET